MQYYVKEYFREMRDWGFPFAAHLPLPPFFSMSVWDVISMANEKRPGIGFNGKSCSRQSSPNHQPKKHFRTVNVIVAFLGFFFSFAFFSLGKRKNF